MTCLCQHLPKGRICVQCAAERGLFPSFDAAGNKKGGTKRAMCKVITCSGSMVVDGYCLYHSRFYRAARQTA